MKGHKMIPVWNLLRNALEPSLRGQFEQGVRKALRKFAQYRGTPDLRVFISSDQVPGRVDPDVWAKEEAEHLRQFAAQWAVDQRLNWNGRVEVLILDTIREFARVNPATLHGQAQQQGKSRSAREPLHRDSSAHSPATAVVILELLGKESTKVTVRNVAVLGREGADIILNDTAVSRRHASISVSTRGAQIVDLDSRNGTAVNGKNIPTNVPLRLKVGDLLKVGSTELRVLQTP